MNVQLVPELFVEIPVELAADLGIKGGDKVKVTSARASYHGQSDGDASHPAHDHRRQEGLSDRHPDSLRLPRHSGGCRKDAALSGQLCSSPTVTDPNAYTPEFKGFLVKLEKAYERHEQRTTRKSKPSPDTPGRFPGRDTSRDYDVCKLIDVTTCIGCKACEVACLEWNGYPFRETVFDNTYQTMPDLAWNYYNLIRFNEHVAEDGTLQLADAQGRLHALRRSRLPARLSRRRRHRAIRQRHRRFPAGQLHRLPVLRHRLPVQHSEVQPRDQEGSQVHAVLGSRGRGTGAGLHQGLSHRLPAFRQQRRHEGSGREARDAAARAHFAQERRRLRSARRRRHARDVRAARHRPSGALRRLAQGSARSADGPDLEGPAEVARQFRDGRRNHRRARCTTSASARRRSRSRNQEGEPK